MASLFWSWIFILQLIRPCFANVDAYNGVHVALRAVEKVHDRTKAEKTRDMVLAVSITGSILLLTGLVGLVAVIWRHKTRAKEADPEAVEPADSAEKPNWFMADDKKNKWWRISLTTAPPTPLEGSQQSEPGRIERLKVALNKKAARTGRPLLPMFKSPQPSPRDTMKLPFQAIPEEPLKFPDPLESGYRAPIYVADQQPAPHVPSLTRTMYDADGQPEPRSPPKAIVTQGKSRTHARNDKRAYPRSPATRRKSWMRRSGQPRHPFVPLKEEDIPVAKTAAVEGSFMQSFSKPQARTVPEQQSDEESVYEESPPPMVPSKKRVPAPLNLPRLGEYKHGFGLPSSPRGLPSSPRPRRVQTPVF